MKYDEEAMATERDENGVVKGYLAKTAQNITTFSRKQFHRRYYELDIQAKQLKIYADEGGNVKDVVQCSVTHVVASLNETLRDDYKTFFEQSSYKKIKIKLPAEFAHPFAVFMEDGTMMVLWAATKSDLQEWINGFTDTIVDD